jgi:transmembrane sensor
MKPQEFKDLLAKFERGECNENEVKLINEWYDAINEGQVAEIEPVEIEPLEIEGRLWSLIDPESSVSPTSRFPFWMKAAATILLLFVAGLGSYFMTHEGTLQEQIAILKDKSIPNDDFVIVVNNDRTAKELVLDDGSQITLKPNGKLRYAKQFNGAIREVYLDGEAFFKVKRDTQRPFIVYSNELVTKVLGTSFNVKAYKDDKEITVAVKSGKVSVSANVGQQNNNVRGQQSVVLTPNQEAVYNRVHESVSKRLVEKPEIILPVPTLFKMQYDGTPVAKIFEVLEENYGVDIQFEAETLKDCVLTTSMSDEGLYERLQVICKAINADYVETDGIIFIKGGNSCR